jgi:ribosomal-protein-alanine N-acetyltransferase
MVRLADEDDIPGLLEVEEKCFGKEKFSPETIRAFIERDDAFILAALEDDRIVGSAMALMSDLLKQGKVASVAVLKDFRGKGVGSALLRECEKIFESQGLKKYSLEVDTMNELAIALYSSRGYEIKGMLRDFYGFGRNAYYMEKKVGPSPMDVRG